MRNRLHVESNILGAMVQKQVDKWRYIHNINAEYGKFSKKTVSMAIGQYVLSQTGV